MTTSRSRHRAADVAEGYARAVVDGETPACRWTRLACRRQLDDLENAHGRGLVFDADRAERIVKFFELTPHVKGRWAGAPIELEPWQVFILTTVFGWVRGDGTRRFRSAYNEVARKNAKSTMSAALGLYMLTADGEPGAEVYSAATTHDQARIVFNDARVMTLKSPRLAQRIGVNARNLHVLSTGSKFEALSAEYRSLDGLNVHCAIIDELHAHKTRAVYDVIETATGARSQALLWMITTAGSNRAGICYEQRTYITKILEGLVEDDSCFGIIYSIDDGDDWTDPETWIKANPNLGVSVYFDDLERQCLKAQQLPSARNAFLTKRLNVWVNADTAWMDMQAWEACGRQPLDPVMFECDECYMGLDLASKVDVAVLMLLFLRDGHYYCFGRYYLPEETVEAQAHATHAHYAGWAREGLLTLTPGNVIDFGCIRDDILDLSGRFDVQQIAYDPWQATHLATELYNQGAPMVECRPTVQNFSEPMKELEALVRSGKLHHGGDPVLTWMVSNVVCHLDRKDNIYPNKERPENKIDGVVALIMALGQLLRNRVDELSVDDARGIEFF